MAERPVAHHVTAVQYRESEATEDILQELLQDADNAMQVDCAGPTVQFVVNGWFVFPLGSMNQNPNVTSAA